MPYRINRQTGTTDYVDASSGAALVQTTAPKPAPAQSGGFLRSVSNFLIPRTTKLFDQIGATGRLSALTRQEEEERKKRQQQIEQLISQAKHEADPTQRSQRLAQARDLAAQGTQQIKSAIGRYEQETGTKIDDKQRVMAEAFGVAGELGTFFVPAGKLAQGAKLTQRILQGAKLGAKVGLLHGVTNPEAETVEKKVKAGVTEAGVGALTAGATMSAFEVPRAIVKKFVGGNSERISRLFRMAPSERAKFRKSTGGMNFEEEIIARDGRAIMGKDYPSLLEHFGSRTDEANQALDTLLAESNKAVSKQKVVTALQQQIKNLRPSKGNVGTAGAISQVQTIIDDLNQFTSDDIPVTVANNIKRQLQGLGDAAYSPSGKATPTSEAMAKAGSMLRQTIENVFEGKNNPVRESNRTIQLYEAARRSIERTGDREAVKISNDLGQKFIQMLPTVAAIAGAGIGYQQGGIGGGVGGLTLAALLVGGAGASRVGYLSPQFQTRIAGFFGNVLKSNGVKNFDAMASKISMEISRQVARQQTLDLSEGVSFPGQESVMDTVSGATVEAGQGLQSTIQGGENQQGTAIPQQLQQVEANQPDSGTIQKGSQVHTDNLDDTVTIRNSKTGEVRQVKKNELGQYGLAIDSPNSLPGLPTKAEILAAMVLDAQKGGKNIAKLMTILDAYDKVLGTEEGKGKIVPAAQAGVLGDFDSAISLMDEVEQVLTASSDKFGPVRGAIGAANPYATESQQVESDLRRAVQIIGKAMEGGVLRKEDEIKYRRMLPKLTDTPAVARYKMKQVRNMLELNRLQRKRALEAAGYDPETDRISATAVGANPAEF